MFDKAAVLALLADEGIWHEVTEHAAVYTMGNSTASLCLTRRQTQKTCSCATISGKTIT